jgi:hypothetical protein
VGAFPEEGLILKLIGTYWAKGAAIVVCQDKETQDWLRSNVPVMKAWEGCRLEFLPPTREWQPGFRALRRAWNASFSVFFG